MPTLDGALSCVMTVADSPGIVVHTYPMKYPSEQSFGLVIAYLIPGFTALWGLSYFSDPVSSWLSPATNSPSVGGFLFGTIASLGAGLTVSAVRWLVVDRIHELTGLRRPSWSMSELQANIDAFKQIVQDRYRYYQFYANMLVAIPIALGARKVATGIWLEPALDASVVATMLVLYLASRDTLEKYYDQSGATARREAVDTS